MKETIFESVDHYINELFVTEDEILKTATKNADEANIPKISLSPNGGKFLHILARLHGAKKILEIGTLSGYSTIWLARALPKDGQLITLEIDPFHAKIAQQNIIHANLENIVDIRIGKALEILPKLKEEGIAPFDMIFIDADKPPYAEYLQWSLKLAKPGTLIVADNVIREGTILDENCQDEKDLGIQRFNKLLSKSHVTATIIQTVGIKGHDGMAIAIVN